MRADNVTASFGEILRDHRRAAGLTQEELAERSGVSARSISELERGGEHVPRRDTVALLARALDLSGVAREQFENVVVRPPARRRAATPARVQLDQPPVQPLPAFEPPRHNVPHSLTSFVGREQELRDLAPRVALAPLLTLVGAGGVGKTRLAQELAREQIVSYPDGCWFVELAPLMDPSLVPGAVASAVGLRDFRAQDTTDVLRQYLSQKQLLLVFDNCEHLIDACAELVAHLLGACPRLHVLATSREPLGVAGETTWQVLPLELPDVREALTSDKVMRTAAARLFVERAQAVNHALNITDANASAIARICIGVDGIPLALELAAARARLLTLAQLADRLERDLAVLVGTNRLGLPQHRTIRATIDWSHDLLGEQEQILLRRLSVFAGGFTLESAEEVCSAADLDRADIINVLAQLVDKSMTLVDARDSVARYRLLEPIRQYALDRLEASGEATTYRARHSDATLRLVLTDQAGGAGPDEISSLDRLEREHDNIRVALRWALTHDNSQAALRCSAALFRFWERRGHFQEGCAWLERALTSAHDAPARDRSWALNALAFLYWRGGDTVRARPVAEQALAASLEGGTPRDVAQALLNLGMIAYFLNEPGRAVEFLEQSVDMARQGGNAPQLSLALTFLGRILLWVKGPQDQHAFALLEESIRLAEAAESRYAIGHALVTRGDLAWRQGELAAATQLWKQALEVRCQLAERRGVAGCLERLALIEAANGQFGSAAWLFGAADAQHAALGVGLRHDEEIDHAQLLGLTREHLGEAFATAWAAGQGASLDEAVARALEQTRRR